jgi:hypothetical protein
MESTQPDVQAIRTSFERYNLFVSIRTLCLCVGCVHGLATLGFVIGAVTSSDAPRIVTPLSQTMGAWIRRNDSDASASHGAIGRFLNQDKCPLLDSRGARSNDYDVQPITIQAGTIDTRWLIVVFHLLSCIFQIGSALNSKAYTDQIESGKTELSHFVEYSFSASVMMMAICSQLGVTDLNTRLGAFCNTWACMMFGLLAEILFEAPHGAEDDSVPPFEIPAPSFMRGPWKWPFHWIAHVAGWVTLAFAASTVYSNMSLYDACRDSENTPAIPWFVHTIVTGESVLFSLFGLVQLVEFWYKPRFARGGSLTTEHVVWAFRTEYAYIWLSLTAKLWLGGFIYYGNYKT